MEQIDCSLAQKLLLHLPSCVPRAMFDLLGGRKNYLAKHRMGPNYETEDQNFPLDTKLQAMRLKKKFKILTIRLSSFRKL